MVLVDSGGGVLGEQRCPATHSVHSPRSTARDSAPIDAVLTCALSDPRASRLRKMSPRSHSTGNHPLPSPFPLTHHPPPTPVRSQPPRAASERRSLTGGGWFNYLRHHSSHRDPPCRASPHALSGHPVSHARMRVSWGLSLNPPAISTPHRGQFGVEGVKSTFAEAQPLACSMRIPPSAAAAIPGDHHTAH